MNWRDPMQVEHFLDALALSLAHGLGPPAAIAAARQEAERAGSTPPTNPTGDVAVTAEGDGRSPFAGPL